MKSTLEDSYKEDNVSEELESLYQSQRHGKKTIKTQIVIFTKYISKNLLLVYLPLVMYFIFSFEPENPLNKEFVRNLFLTIAYTFIGQINIGSTGPQVESDFFVSLTYTKIFLGIVFLGFYMRNISGLLGLILFVIGFILSLVTLYHTVTDQN